MPRRPSPQGPPASEQHSRDGVPGPRARGALRARRRAALFALACLLIPVGLATACTSGAGDDTGNGAGKGGGKDTHRTCLTGTLTYSYADAQSGTDKPSRTEAARNANWELWGAAADGDALRKLASGLTDADDGHFTACAPGGGTLAKARVTFRSASSELWEVVDERRGGAQYAFDTATRTDVGGVRNVGTVQVPASMRNAWHVVDTLNHLYAQRANPASACWTAHQRDGDCDRLTFVWLPKKTDDSGYWDGGYEGEPAATNRVVVSGDMTDSEHLILHEAGHWWMWQLYGHDYPEVTDCSPHYVDRSSSPSCAWTEGFADAVAAYALDDERYVQEDGEAHDLSGSDTGDWDEGDTVQGRVGVSLLDLWAQDGPDGGNWDATIRLMTGDPDMSADFRDYFTVDRPAASPPLSTDGAAAEILARQTITY